MKSIKYAIISLFFSVFVLGCTKAIIDEGEAPDPIDKIITYNPDVQKIAFNHCVTCHGGVAPSANLDLTNYQNVRSSTENGALLSRINDISNPMPPSGLLSQEDRQIIEKWVEDGFLEN